MLTREENEVFTRVGPGQPAGELLRRYWQPVAVLKDLSPDQPTHFVRVLGEDLVLFRDLAGRVGLVADRCAHRGCSLAYGRVEQRGIACPYHGWLYDTAGNVLETPPERNDAIIRSVKQRAYPVRQMRGLHWAYMGPPPAPEIPPFDVWVRTDGLREIEVHPILDCNWFQAMENSVDPAHLMILHQGVGRYRNRKPESTTRGFIDEVESADFEPWEFGIMKRRVFKNGLVEAHPLLFPNILRVGNSTQFRVPIDDTHTWHVHIEFYPTRDGSTVHQEDDEIPVSRAAPYKTPDGALHPAARYHMDSVIAQDHMAWETQGPVADRSAEHLSYSDRGVSVLRRLTLENIERVRRGEDPLGVVRRADHPMIDTNLEATLAEMHVTGRFKGYAEAAGGGGAAGGGAGGGGAGGGGAASC